MLKSIVILALILLVGFCSISLPIELNHLLYIPVEQSISYSFQPAHTEITNPQLINFSMTTTGTNISIKNIPGKNLKIEAYKDGTPVENLRYVEYDAVSLDENILIAKNNPVVIQVDISQKTTGLPDGEYLYRFFSQNDKLKEITPLELKVSYKSNPQYVKSLNYQPKDNMGLILYFPSTNYKYLIPVTRFIPYNAAILTKTVENLGKGADPATTLPTEPAIPEVNKVYYNGSTVFIEVDSKSGNLVDNGNLFMALDSIVHAMTQVPGMRRVQFLLDGKRVDEIAPGISTRNPWSADTSPAAYLSYNTFDRYLLFPYRPDTSGAATIRDQCYILFETLKKGLPEDPLVQAVIPDNVELLNVYYLNRTLKLDFNPALLEAYKDDRHKQYMMMDAILYTFSSIANIKDIQLLVNGSDQYSFADYKFSKPLTRPLYLNPEKN